MPIAKINFSLNDDETLTLCAALVVSYYRLSPRANEEIGQLILTVSTQLADQGYVSFVEKLRILMAKESPL